MLFILTGDTDKVPSKAGIVALSAGGSADCNGNGVPDDCDIAGGTSADCTCDGVPDECEPDCNGNGVADSCDIAAGTSADCNTNGIPDDCEWTTSACCLPSGSCIDTSEASCANMGGHSHCDSTCATLPHPAGQCPMLPR